MRSSQDRILTSHAGSLPRPDGLIEANRARESGQAVDETADQAQHVIRRLRGGETRRAA